MKIFLTGANGWVGSAIARDLLDGGHSVTGLVRTLDKGKALAKSGVAPVIGSLTDLDTLRRGAEESDGVIHTAFGLDFTRMNELAAEDRGAIEAFGQVFAGSRRPIVVTGGLLLSDEPLTEAGRPPVNPDWPRASEQTAFALAERGVAASCVRLPRSVHGVGETHGFIPMLAAVARDKCVSAWVGDGANVWPAVHRDDAARAFRLALERGVGGEAYHAAAEEGVPYRAIAEAIGRQIGVPARSLSAEEAEAHFGWLAMWAAGNGPASTKWTRAALGWEPTRIGLVEDIGRPEYGRRA